MVRFLNLIRKVSYLLMKRVLKRMYFLKTTNIDVGLLVNVPHRHRVSYIDVKCNL